MADNDQHIYHHNDKSQQPTINVKVEKNTKGYNYSATVEGAGSVDEAMALLDKVMKSLATAYGAGGAEA